MRALICYFFLAVTCIAGLTYIDTHGGVSKFLPSRQKSEFIARLNGIENSGEIVFAECIVSELCYSMDTTFLKYLGDKEAFYSLEGRIRAAIDMGDFNPDSDITIENGIVNIQLPPVKWIKTIIDPNGIKLEHEKVSGISNEFTARERREIHREGEEKIEELKKTDYGNRIKNEAEASARQFFTAIALQAGFQSCTIKFKN